ncbi:MAG TPA: hypothetical protein VJ739_16145 [Gemmataceae bacterium]|nr:hypothetical protein [Gemmataceae bacterium]
MMGKVRKLFRAFWHSLGGKKSNRQLSLVQTRLLVEPLEERWLLDAHNLLWIGPQDNNSNMSYAQNWIDLNTGGYFAPVAGNNDSITFDPTQVFNNTVLGSDSDATDDIPT